VWQRNRHSSKQRESSDEDPHSDDILQHDFLRKYLHFAKTRMHPELTEGARDFIANRYAEMRCRQDERTLPVTARTLETVIRLASAHAKARLSNVVEAEPDCQQAMDILGFALYHENTDASSSKEEVEPVVAQVSDEDDDDDMRKEPNEFEPLVKKRKSDVVDTLMQDMKRQLWDKVVGNDGAIEFDTLCENADHDQVSAAVEALVKENRLMVSDGTVYMVD
jgi:DNA replicative helicase MCM subunit Mcm2 (Cdc46/Mcm family)